MSLSSEWVQEGGGLRAAAVLFALLLSLFAGIALVVLPPILFTLAASLMVMILILARPMAGIVIVLTMLYFPLLPNVSLAGFEFSATALPVLTLGATALMSTRMPEHARPLAKWQWLLLASLAGAFGLASLLSTSYEVTIPVLPNLGLYVVILFAMMVLIDTPQKLVWVAKVILVLAFVLSIWRVELRPLRGLVGLPSLGINGAIFAFHPAVGLGLVVMLMPGSLFSRRWRWFAGMTLLSLVLHGITYEGRAGILTWGVMLMILLTRLNVKRSFVLLASLVLVGALVAEQYQEVIQRNLFDTQMTLDAMTTGNWNIATASGDRLRMAVMEAGWRMFQERPIFGWGPDLFTHLNADYVRSGDYAGREAFNSWLNALVEMGLVGGVVSLAAFVAPVLITWREVGRRRDALQLLAFGFALGAFGLAFHLFFIDLLYSFAWVHAGLGLAAARISMGPPSAA